MYVCHVSVCDPILDVCDMYIPSVNKYMYCTTHVVVLDLYIFTTHTKLIIVPYLGALLKFDGDFAPDFGTQHPPANYCPENSSLSPNHSYKLYNYMQYPGTHLFDHWWYMYLFFVHIMRHMFQASWVKPIVVFIVQQIAQFTRVQIRNLDNV